MIRHAGDPLLARQGFGQRLGQFGSMVDIGIVREDAEILQPFGQLREAQEGAERRLDAAQPAFTAVERTRDAQAPEFGVLHIGREVGDEARRSEEHTSELQSLMRISYAVFCLKKKHKHHKYQTTNKLNMKTSQ